MGKIGHFLIEFKKVTRILISSSKYDILHRINVTDRIRLGDTCIFFCKVLPQEIERGFC